MSMETKAVFVWTSRKAGPYGLPTSNMSGNLRVLLMKTPNRAWYKLPILWFCLTVRRFASVCTVSYCY